MTFVKKSLFPYFFQRPPFGLYKVVVICYVRVVHVRPEADSSGEVLPHTLVLPYTFLTFLYERLKTVFLNLLLAVKTELLFDLKLNGKSVSVPAGFTKHLVALHCAVTRNHVLYNTR